MSISKRKIIAFVLSCMIVSTAFSFAGCGQENSNYPVTVGNITFDKEPKNIVVLSDDIADIISCIGYDVKMVGKSDSVTQEELSVVPSVGSKTAPDTSIIITNETDVVFCNESLDENIKETLEDNGIKIIKMMSAETPEELETVYRSLGKILGGKTAGVSKAQEAYNNLISSMEDVKSKYSSGSILNTVCYVYTDGDQVKIAGKNTLADLILSYTGAVNVAVEAESQNVQEASLNISNPTYIFYSDKTALDTLKADNTLKNLSAVKSNKVMEIPLTNMSRHGITALADLQAMVDFMYPVENTNATVAATTENNDLAKEYNITIPAGGFTLEDENDNVKAMQIRLKDLGYVSDEENITGYYGQITQRAVTEFQKQNSIEETGTADKATLEKMFSPDAVKAESPVDAESEE